jgi:hypothetical protein
LIELDKIDFEWYFLRILFHSFERDGIGQKLNLAHAGSEALGLETNAL